MDIVSLVQEEDMEAGAYIQAIGIHLKAIKKQFHSL